MYGCHRGEYGVQLFAEIIVWSVTLIKLMGTDCLVKWSGLMCILSIIPSVIFMVDGFKKVDPHTWVCTCTGTVYIYIYIFGNVWPNTCCTDVLASYVCSVYYIHAP